MSNQTAQLNLFIKFALRELNIEKPKITFVGNSENKNKTFGHMTEKEIVVRITERHPIDVMRTIAHELVHVKQYKNGVRNFGIKEEDEANAIAGRIMRKFDNRYPHLFTSKPIQANIAEEMTSSAPVNAMGGGENVSVVDKFLKFIKRNKNPRDVRKQLDTRGTGPTSMANKPFGNVFDNGNKASPLDFVKDVINSQKKIATPIKNLKKT